MSKEKQEFNLASTGIPNNAYRNQKPAAEYNAEYFAKLRQDRKAAERQVAPMPLQMQQETSERAKKLKELYPDSYEKDIPLTQLVPAPAEWNFFPHWNNEQIAELMENISVYGQLSPALVWEQADGSYMILGGHNRYRALKNLHDMLASQYPEEAALYTTMRCNVYAHDTLDEVEARKIIIYDNTIRRENSKAVMCRSIINMNQLMKETRKTRRPDTKRRTIYSQIAETMDISEGKVSGIISLRNLIPEFWPLFDEKDKSHRISNSLGLALSRLPQNLQEYVYEHELYVNVHLSSKQLKQLRYAQTEEAVEAVLGMPSAYHMTVNVETEEQPSKGYHPFVIFATETERDVIKQVILNSGVSEETKKWAQKTL